MPDERLVKLLYDTMTDKWRDFELEVRCGLYTEAARRLARHMEKRGVVLMVPVD